MSANRRVIARPGSTNPASAQTPTPVLPPLVTQQQTNERIRSLSDRTPTPPHDYVIGRGDLVSVEVFDVPELTRELRVSQTGTIGIPLVPVRLSVTGLTELQVQQKVTEVLEANGLVSHPQVMVSVKEKKSQPITVVGAVSHPMVYQADHPVTLVQILAEVGGVSADAGDTIIITRPDTTAVGETPMSPRKLGGRRHARHEPRGQKSQRRNNRHQPRAREIYEPQAVRDPEGAAKAPAENSGTAPPAILERRTTTYREHHHRQSCGIVGTRRYAEQHSAAGRRYSDRATRRNCLCTGRGAIDQEDLSPPMTARSFPL